MEEFKIWSDIFQHYGWPGLVTLYLLYDRILKPQWRKRTGEFVHWKDLKKKLDEDNDEIKQIKRVMNSQLEKEMEKDRRMNVFEMNLGTVERNVEDMKYFLREASGQQKTTNRLLGEVKDAMESLKDKMP